MGNPFSMGDEVIIGRFEFFISGHIPFLVIKSTNSKSKKAYLVGFIKQQNYSNNFSNCPT